MVVLLLMRFGTACLGWACLRAEGICTQSRAGDLIRDTGFSVAVESAVTAILAGMEKEQYGLSSVVGLGLFVSGHITFRQC